MCPDRSGEFITPPPPSVGGEHLDPRGEERVFEAHPDRARPLLFAEQRAVIIIAVALFTLSELFPPWRYEYRWGPEYHYIDDYKHLCPAGYSFIAHPPPVRPNNEMLRLCRVSDVPPLEKISTQKDLWLLNCQRLILLLGSSFFLGLSTRRTKIHTVVGGILLSLGTIITGLYILTVLVGY